MVKLLGPQGLVGLLLRGGSPKTEADTRVSADTQRPPQQMPIGGDSLVGVWEDLAQVGNQKPRHLSCTHDPKGYLSCTHDPKDPDPLPRLFPPPRVPLSPVPACR